MGARLRLLLLASLLTWPGHTSDNSSGKSIFSKLLVYVVTVVDVIDVHVVAVSA